MFHTIVSELLFLCKQARPNILITVELLTTQVKELKEDEDKKLGHILKYHSGMRDLILTLESNGNETVKWCVDAAFAVHHGTKIHTGGMMSMGRGAI